MMMKTKEIFLTLLFVLLAAGTASANIANQCPEISVSDSPVAVAPGESILFSLVMKSDLKLDKYTFVWKVNQGSIVEGQGTQTITVSTSGLEKTLIIATLQIVGLPRECKNVYSATGNVKAPVPICDNFGFGEIPENDVRARLDAFFAESQNRPSKTLYVVTDGKKEQIDKLHNLIKAYAKTFAAKYNLDTSRISYIRNYYDQEILTRFWLSCGNDKGGCCYRPKFEVTSCPSSITVVDPPVAVSVGENITFTANIVSGVEYENLGYNWKTDKGEIVEGQGTPTIIVSTKGLVEPYVNATVNITGMPKHCANSASGSSLIHIDYEPILHDEFGVVSKKLLKTKIESFSKNLEKDPNATGYIVSYGKPKDVKKREKVIGGLIFRSFKIDSPRIVFVKGGNEKMIRTRLWIVPAGADPSKVN